MSLELSKNEAVELLKDAWLGVKVNENKLFNPLLHIPSEVEQEPYLYITWLMGQPEYFSLFCSEILNVQLLPFQLVILRELWNRRFPMLIGCRGSSKSFLLGLYALLRLIFIPGRKLVICSGGFRQAKIIFNYMEDIWRNAPIVRDMLSDSDNGPKHDPDMFRFHIGEGIAIAIPLGMGDKIRGHRAQDILIDEMSSVPRDIFETVIAGFAVVRSGPVEVVKRRAMEELSKQFGFKMEKDERNVMNNQIIMAGTAYYDFNHFSEYWKRWKTIIYSRGDKSKLSEIFKDEVVPDDFDWRDYSIIRLPFELIPKGFLDEGMIARSRATMHTGIYQMEYGACSVPGTKIITDVGLRDIEKVKIGDLVLTHKGRFRKVSNIMKRYYDDNLVSIKTYGYNQYINFTPEHEFFTGDNFTKIDDINSILFLSNLKELNGKLEIDIRDFCSNFMNYEDYIYTQYGKTKLFNNDVKTISKLYQDGYSISSIAKMYNVRYETIRSIVFHNRKPKNSVPSIIKLDYNFGLCVGYYAAEGSIGGKGKACGFALDGHVDNKLEFFVDELCNALFSVFGIIPKRYNKEDNSVSITINSKIVADLFSNLCPGICYDKYVLPEILFSNEDFIKGFIKGFWHGDGHIRDKMAVATITGDNLLSQVRLCLSYFGIPTIFRSIKGDRCVFGDKTYDESDKFSIQFSGKFLDKFNDIFYITDSINKSDRRKSLLIDNNDDYSIFRIKDKKSIPYSGYVYNLEVEEDNSYSILNASVHNCFTADSNGFFKRSLVESCVVGDHNEIYMRNDKVDFTPMLVGQSNKRYVFGIDPASEVDRFSIVVLEHYDDHRRIVYVWSTNRKEYKEKLKEGLIKDTDFYTHCVHKIRDLMKKFPCVGISIDTQGGGVAVCELLHSQEILGEGEIPIWPIIDPNKEKDTDGESGLHLLDLVNFASSEWTSEANHGLRSDFENKVCVFPRFDAASFGLASLADSFEGRVYNTMEDCILEIEELKNELVTIMITQTATGRDHWSTPEIKLAGNRKGHMSKDRYSALLMANMFSRTLSHAPAPLQISSYGGFAMGGKLDYSGSAYRGPSWWTNKMNDVYNDVY